MLKLLPGVAAGALMIVFALFFLLPLHAFAGQMQCGKVSFYSEAHQGKLMANGRPFNMNAMTAASWYYPLGTKVTVRNVQNGRIVQVTITDRGPAKRLRRIIDLSKAAFAKLAPTAQGIIKTACITTSHPP